MKPVHILISLIIGIALGGLAGGFLERTKTQAAMIGHLDSDSYRPALAAIAKARAKIQAGDSSALTHLDEAESEIKKAQQWARRFLGQQDDSVESTESAVGH